MSKIFIIIPTHNRKTLLYNCLLSLYKQVYLNYQIIVVDDGSTDGTSEMLSREFPEIETLFGDGNLWWTGAINKGIKYAMTKATSNDFILVINDDLEVRKDYLQTMIDLVLTNKNTLIGSVVVDINDQDKIIYGGEFINPWTAKRRVFNIGRNLSDFDPKTYIEVSRLTGRGILIPINVFYEIGLYDEKHFKQCGDLELPSRAKKHGFRLILSYSSVILSHINETANINSRDEYKLRDIGKVFFNIKSNNNIKYVFYNCRTDSKNLIHFILFFIFSIGRKFGHFILNVRSF